MFRLSKMLAMAWFLFVPMGLWAQTDADGFEPLFNGKNLEGWVPVNTQEGTFYVKDKMIVTTGLPTGFMRTQKQYQNFILELEWKHTNTKEVGNSGLFLWADPFPALGSPFTRGIEVQVLVNLESEGNYTSHGDIFSIWGATCVPDRAHPKGWPRCLPSERRAKGGGEWNHYRVEAKNGSLKLAVNGKVVSGVSKASPSKGYIALEAEGAECMFRNLKIKELPAEAIDEKEATPLAQDHRFLLGHYGLGGFVTKPDTPWTMRDWMLAYRGKKGTGSSEIWTIAKHGNIEFVADWKFPTDNNPQGTQGNRKAYLGLRGSNKALILLTDGKTGSGGLPLVEADLSLPEAVRLAAKPALVADTNPLENSWNRLEGSLLGNQLSLKINGKEVIKALTLEGVPSEGPLGLIASEGPVDFANLFVRELK